MKKLNDSLKMKAISERFSHACVIAQSLIVRLLWSYNPSRKCLNEHFSKIFTLTLFSLAIDRINVHINSSGKVVVVIALIPAKTNNTCIFTHSGNYTDIPGAYGKLCNVYIQIFQR